MVLVGNVDGVVGSDDVGAAEGLSEGSEIVVFVDGLVVGSDVCPAEGLTEGSDVVGDEDGDADRFTLGASVVGCLEGDDAVSISASNGAGVGCCVSEKHCRVLISK